MRASAFYLAPLLLVVATPAAARQSLQARGEAELAKALDGRIAGKPEQCLTLSRVEGSYIVDGTAIVYRAIGGKLYVNRTLDADWLREDDIPVQYVYGGQICRLDHIKLLDRVTGTERGFVGLGDFVPYTKSDKAH